jgi:hypothetical protein
LADFSLRPAHESDVAAIKALIHLVQINPMDLDWKWFVVATLFSPLTEAGGCVPVPKR